MVVKSERLTRGFDARHALYRGKLIDIVFGQAVRVHNLDMMQIALLDHLVDLVFERRCRPLDAHEHGNTKRHEHQDAEKRYERLANIREELCYLSRFHSNVPFLLSVDGNQRDLTSNSSGATRSVEMFTAKGTSFARSDTSPSKST